MTHKELKNLVDTTNDWIKQFEIINLKELIIVVSGANQYYIVYKNNLKDFICKGSDKECVNFLRGIIFTCRFF